MSKYKFELFYGSNKAPIKAMSFISVTCTYCAEFLQNDLSKLKQLSKIGKVQFAFFPYLRRDIDELVYTNMIASRANQEKASLMLAKFNLKEKPNDAAQFYQMVNDNHSSIGFSVYNYEKIKSANRIRSNLHKLNGIARNAWRIKSLPGSVINGFVMKNPNNGRLIRDVSKLIKVM